MEGWAGLIWEDYNTIAIEKKWLAPSIRNQAFLCLHQRRQQQPAPTGTWLLCPTSKPLSQIIATNKGNLPIKKNKGNLATAGENKWTWEKRGTDISEDSSVEMCSSSEGTPSCRVAVQHSCGHHRWSIYMGSEFLFQRKPCGHKRFRQILQPEQNCKPEIKLWTTQLIHEYLND